MIYKILFITLGSATIITPISVYIYYDIKERKKGKRLPLGIKTKKESIIKRIFYDLPKQMAIDKYNKNDFEFTENGLHLIVGEQGSGKTIAMTYLLLKYKEEFPKLKIKTNMCYKYEDEKIKSWKDLIFSNNGIYGEIDVLDEIQNWFNSLESKDFPVEMLQEITQQRKQKKMIIGTSQVWNRVAKPIREQVKYVYKPITLFGCLTIVRKFKPIVKDDGQIEELKYRNCFFFIQNDTIRNAYDTLKKIEIQSLKGFKKDGLRGLDTDTGNRLVVV